MRSSSAAARCCSSSRSCCWRGTRFGGGGPRGGCCSHRCSRSCCARSTRYPLGSIVQARVDAWLIPWVAVVLALALTDLARLPGVQRILNRVPQAVRIATIGFVVVLLGVGVARDAEGYPPTRAQRRGGPRSGAGRARAKPTYVGRERLARGSPPPGTDPDRRRHELGVAVLGDPRRPTSHTARRRRAARGGRTPSGVRPHHDHRRREDISPSATSCRESAVRSATCGPRRTAPACRTTKSSPSPSLRPRGHESPASRSSWRTRRRARDRRHPGSRRGPG